MMKLSSIALTLLLGTSYCKLTNSYLLFPHRFGLLPAIDDGPMIDLWTDETDRMIDRMEHMFDNQLTLSRDRMMDKMMDKMEFPKSNYNVVINDDDKMQIDFTLPNTNFDVDNVKMSIDDNNMLCLNGEKKVEKDNYHSSCTFSQRITLDPSIDKDKVTAELKDGVLHVVAPKDMKLLEESKATDTEEAEEKEKIETTATTSPVVQIPIKQIKSEAKDIKIEQKDTSSSSSADEIKEHMEEALKKMK